MSEKEASKKSESHSKSSKSKSSGGSYLSRQAKAKKVVSEEELKGKGTVTPEDVRSLTCATKDYLCPRNANTYDIQFTCFRVRNMEDQRVIFEITKPAPGEVVEPPPSEQQEDESYGRFICYEFPPQLLSIKALGATVEFTVGSQEVRNFTMVERHFFGELCLKDFEITFPFCMPHSTNTCEYIYELPELTDQQKAEIIESPYKTMSDSFYFVDGKLIMHNKAKYAYNLEVAPPQ